MKFGSFWRSSSISVAWRSRSFLFGIRKINLGGGVCERIRSDVKMTV